MSHYVTIILTTALIIASTTAAYADEARFGDRAKAFASARYHDGKQLLLGPQPRPYPRVPATSDCIALYQQRLALRHERLDYKPGYWDDPRNQTAVFIGTIWSPVFYFLGYTAVSAHLADLNDADPTAELDALSAASQRQRCFER